MMDKFKSKNALCLSFSIEISFQIIQKLRISARYFVLVLKNGLLLLSIIKFRFLTYIYIYLYIFVYIYILYIYRILIDVNQVQ